MSHNFFVVARSLKGDEAISMLSRGLLRRLGLDTSRDEHRGTTRPAAPRNDRNFNTSP